MVAGDPPRLLHPDRMKTPAVVSSRRDFVLPDFVLPDFVLSG
jgi:hypothetical protein